MRTLTATTAPLTLAQLVAAVFAVAIGGYCFNFFNFFNFFHLQEVSALTTTTAGSTKSLWKVLEDAQQPSSNQPSLSAQQAWKTIFGANGERGEYMDGYSEKAMIERCREDYQWATTSTPASASASERRANMMSYLYDDDRLPSITS